MTLKWRKWKKNSTVFSVAIVECLPLRVPRHDIVPLWFTLHSVSGPSSKSNCGWNELTHMLRSIQSLHLDKENTFEIHSRSIDEHLANRFSGEKSRTDSRAARSADDHVLVRQLLAGVRTSSCSRIGWGLLASRLQNKQINKIFLNLFELAVVALIYQEINNSKFPKEKKWSNIDGELDCFC